MLVYNPLKRISPSDALKLDLFKNLNKDTNKIEKLSIEKLDKIEIDKSNKDK